MTIAADRGQQVQGVDLGPVEVLAAEVARRVSSATRATETQIGDRHEHRERVERERAADERDGAVVADVVPLDDGEHDGDGRRSRP